MVRTKHRYVFAEMNFDGDRRADITASALHSILARGFLNNFGEYGLALVKCSLSIKYVNTRTRFILVRIRRGAELMLSNVLSCITLFRKCPVKFQTLHISGSIRCAQKFWLKYNRRKLTEQIKACTDPEQKAKLIQEIKSINERDYTDSFKQYSVFGRGVKFKTIEAKTDDKK